MIFPISADTDSIDSHIEMLYHLYKKIPLLKKSEIIRYCDEGPLVYINHQSDYTWIRICMDHRKMYAIDIENDMWTVELKKGERVFFYFKGYFKHFLSPINQITYVDTIYSEDVLELNTTIMRLHLDMWSVLKGFLAHSQPLFERKLFKVIHSYLTDSRE